MISIAHHAAQPVAMTKEAVSLPYLQEKIIDSTIRLIIVVEAAVSVGIVSTIVTYGMLAHFPFVTEKIVKYLLFFVLFSSGSISSTKSRYMDNHNNGNSNDRYSDRQTSSSSTSAWGNPNNGPTSTVKSFGSNHLNHLDTSDWGGIKQQAPDSSNWNRSLDQNQSDRYDRTYNERSKYLDGPVNAGSGSNRPSSFIQSRPQERYNAISSRFEGGRF